MKFEKIVEFGPAYDKRHPDPAEDQGIGCVMIRFVLKGSKGAVQFLMGSGWFLPETVEEYKAKGGTFEKLTDQDPVGWDLGYHSPKPMYEEQPIVTNSCPYLDGKECYYDGSGLNAKPIMERLLREGSDAVWEELAEYYHKTFGES